VAFIDTNATATLSRGFVTLSMSERLWFKNCHFISPFEILIGSATLARFENCLFEGVHDNNQIMTIQGATGTDISGCTAKSLNPSDTSSGFGWAKGRWIVDIGSTYGMYIGGNETIDMLPRTPTPFVSNLTVSARSAVVDGLQTLWFSDDIPDEYDGYGNDSPIWAGVVVPTRYTPTHPNYTEEDWRMKTLDAIGNSVTLYVYPGNLEDEAYALECDLTDKVDPNSGEQYLFEGPAVRFTGKPTAVTSTSATFANTSTLTNGNWLMTAVHVVKGTGLGQTGIIQSITDNGGGSETVNLVNPWRVEPDINSVINIGNLAYRNVFYGNTFDGRPEGTVIGDHRASAGIEVYGTSSDLIIVSNTFTEVRSAVTYVSLDTTQDNNAGVITLNDNIFNYATDNRFIDCYQSINLSDTLYSVGYPIAETGATGLGNVFRNNYSSNNIYAFVSSSFPANPAEYLAKMNIFDSNTILGDSGNVYETPGVVNQVWVGNAFIGSGSGVGIGYEITSGHVPCLHKNSWNIFGSQPGPVLEIPLRYVEMNDKISKSMSVWNSGTAPLSWNASTTNSWLKLTKSSGSVSDENSEDFLSFEVASTNNLAVGSKAIITVTGGGQTKQIAVVYEGGGAFNRATDYIYDTTVYGIKPLRSTLTDMTTGVVLWIKTGLENFGSLTVYSYELELGHDYSLNIEQWDGEKWTTVNIQPDNKKKPYTFRHE